ncbi:MAG: UPF0182 family protein [Eubacteriaceae bacterium]|nr:UPF0182 family protein [Eubacteriaceae bacterium]
MEKKKRKFGKKGVIITIIAIIVIFFALINFITDFLWFKELGYISVFLKKLVTQLEIGIPTFVVVTFVTYVYFKFLKKSYFEKVVSNDIDRGKMINYSSWGLSVVFGLIVTYFVVTKLWFNALKAANSTEFNLKDALFNNDVSFYIFKLDFISQITNLVIGFMVFLIVLTLIYYAVLMSLHRPQVFEKVNEDQSGADFGDDDEFSKQREQFKQKSGGGGNNPFGDMFGKFGEAFNGGGGPRKPVGAGVDTDNIKRLFGIAKTQLVIVGIIFFAAVAVHFFLKQYDLLYNHTGAVYGAGYTDVTIRLWVYRALAVLAVVGAVAVVFGITKKKLKPVIAIPVIMIAVGLVGSVGAVLVQNFVVSPDEINKESKYLERNIEFTQYAYNLGDVTVKSFKADNDLTSSDISKNEATISNIRINDYKPAKTFYNQAQAIRQYYNFSDVDVDRYMVNGKYTQTFLSARELDETKISETWLNTHLKYTHGYGITMSQVNQITASGQPDMLISDIPPVSSIKETQISRPEIYFGESTNDYIMVGTDEDEFDYPDGDSNKYAQYEGSAGIRMTPLTRFMFAVREKSLKLLVSSNIDSDSKIVINRNIKKRVEKIMPYLDYDSDPYMCTVNGKMYWIIDAYTSSNKFPYSEPYDSETSDTNYVRNSVKVVVDAYNGDVNYYVVDDTDAIAKTMQKIYPKLFKDISEMPEDIKDHIRYPNTMFDIQAKVYKRYHMNDVKVFYQNEDLWDISKETYGTTTQEMEPNYYILNLPGVKEEEEFVSSIPYTPKDKRNMTGLLIARNDGDNYGKLVLYKLPKNKVTYGPMQIEAQIDQSTEISKEFSLWSQAGSTYSRGNMFVIPIEDSILYVEPVYLEANDSAIPEVKRVIVAYGDQIAYEPTLAEALNSLFGEGSGNKYESGADKNTTSKTNSKALTQSQIIQKVQDAYDNAIKAQKDGDWSKYGKYMDEMEKYIKKLK